MNYDVVELSEKKIMGIAARTGNTKPDMGNVIGGLWGDFYGKGICQKIRGKVNQHAFGIYSDYKSDANDGDTYQITVGAEVSDFYETEDLIKMTLPAGKYAHFHVFGDQVKAVAAAWAEIWNTPLERTFTGDFEEYTAFDGVNSTVEIYIAIK